MWTEPPISKPRFWAAYVLYAGILITPFIGLAAILKRLL